MITKEQVFPLLFKTCPAIESSAEWQESLQEWGDMEEDHSYLDSSAVAGYIVRKYKMGDTSDFSSFFGFIERLHKEGDPFVKELATIGFLEDILRDLNDKERNGIYTFLGTESKKWWNYLEKFWGGKLTKNHYKLFQKRVTEIVNIADPWYLISGGAPKDEYSQEIARIIAGLKNCEGEEDIRRLVLENLGGEDSNREACEKIAREIYKLRERYFFTKG